MLFSPKRSCFRFAARTLRVQGSQRDDGVLPPLCKGRCHSEAVTEGLSPFGIGARGRGPQAPSPVSAPEPSERRFRCSAWLIHDFAPSPMRALVFRSAYSASRNARASAAFAASIKAHRAVSSKTLMLQVRCAHPPMPHRTSSSSCSGVPVGLFSEKALQLFLQIARPSAAVRPPVGGLRWAASGGRGKLRSPLHPSLLPLPY